MVLLVDEHDFGHVSLSFLFGEFGVAADDHEVTDMHESRGGAIEADGSGTWNAGDGVGCEPIAVIDVVDVDLFPFADVCGLHEDRIDGD